MHTNWIFASPPTWTAENPEPSYSDREKAALGRAHEWWAGDGRGYLAIQSTKVYFPIQFFNPDFETLTINATQPATIAAAHRDPVALLTWIYEKLVAWSDEYAWTDDEVLTWVSLYYFSEAGPEASSYHYYEGMHGSEITVPVVQCEFFFFFNLSFGFCCGGLNVADGCRGIAYIDVPLGLADFPVEISNAPKAWWGTLGMSSYVPMFLPRCRTDTDGLI